MAGGYEPFCFNMPMVNVYFIQVAEPPRAPVTILQLSPVTIDGYFLLESTFVVKPHQLPSGKRTKSY
jgi:hypothetical protein